MILDDVYTAIIARIQTAPTPLGIAMIDWFNNQPDRMEAGNDIEGLILPALLVRYDQPQWKARGRKHYEAQATIYIDVMRDQVNNPMVTDADPADVAATRATYDLVAAVEKRIVGLCGDNFGTFGLIGTEPDHAYSKFRVDTIAFRTLLRVDKNARTYVHVTTPALEILGGIIDAPGGNDVVVSNSDSSYVQVIAAPGALLLPNIVHTDSDGNPVTLPAMVPFVAQLCGMAGDVLILASLPSLDVLESVAAGDAYNLRNVRLIAQLADGVGEETIGEVPIIGLSLNAYDLDPIAVIPRKVILQPDLTVRGYLGGGPSDPEFQLDGVRIFRQATDGTNVLYATRNDGTGYIDERVAIQSPALGDLEYIAGGDTAYTLRSVLLQYTDIAGAVQVLSTHQILSIISGAYQLASAVIPRITLFRSNGSTVIAYVAVNSPSHTFALQPVKNTGGTTVSSHEVNADGVAPDAAIQLKDSAGVNIGATSAALSGITTNKTAPDGAAVNKSSAPTYSLAVKSNGTAVLPQVRIAKRGGGTVDYDYLPTPTAIHTEGEDVHTVREYTASDTWAKPANLKGVWVFIQAAGGGGGGGKSISTAGNARGGGAGGSGAFVQVWIPAASLASTVAVTVGAVGAGGPGALNGDGTDGSNAADSSFGAHAIAKGGTGGEAGKGTGTVTPTNNALNTACTPVAGPYSYSGANATGFMGSLGVVGDVTGSTPPRGGPGGGRTGAAASFIGTDGGGLYMNSVFVDGPVAPAADGGSGPAGTNDVKLDFAALLSAAVLTKGPGSSGAGGNYGNTVNGGNGGNGGRGAGGGGGGGALNTRTSGSGGNGGGGFVTVIEVTYP